MHLWSCGELASANFVNEAVAQKYYSTDRSQLGIVILTS